MKTLITLLIIYAIFVGNWSCVQAQNHSLDKPIFKKRDAIDSQFANHSSDSLELLLLIKNLLVWDWVRKDSTGDFNPVDNPHDTIFTELDWQANKKRMGALSKTNFFSKIFLDNYQSIVLYIAKGLKENKSKWHVGELPPFFSDVDYWCNCQDIPDDDIYKSVQRIKLKDIKIDNDSASFKWYWSGYEGQDWDQGYFVKTKKENGVWKISYLQDFDLRLFIWQ